MEQSPFLEANSQEIPRLLWNPKVHFRLHKTPPLVPILEPEEFTSHLSTPFLQIRSNITFSSTPRSSSCLFPSGFPTRTLYAFLVSSMRAIC